MTGKELKKLRTTAKKTQAEAAESVGISRTAYIKLEQADTVNPKYVDKLEALFQPDGAKPAKASEPVAVSVIIDDVITDETIEEIKTSKKNTKSTVQKPAARTSAKKAPAKSSTKKTAGVQKGTAAKEKVASQRGTSAKGKASAKKEAPAPKTAEDAKPSRTAKPKTRSTENASKPSSATKINIELQYAGKSISYDDILVAAKDFTNTDGSISLYIKPEENRVYYVNDKTTGSFEI